MTALPPLRRALIEFSNLCCNDCFYCGIRRSRKIPRYTLSECQIIDACQSAYKKGYKTFVLQSGENHLQSIAKLCSLIQKLKTLFPDAAVTLSTGEKTTAEYCALRAAGADRYLLKIETPNAEHYKKLHPPKMSYNHRVECLKALQQAGFVVGTGFITGLPFEPPTFFSEAVAFLKKVAPKMIAAGPFVSARSTPFENFPNGSPFQTLRLVKTARTLFPSAFIPATSALGAFRPKALGSGADVIMDNFTPQPFRNFYRLYDLH